MGMSELQAAVRLDPSDPEARIALGLALAAKGMQNEAVAQYRKALELDPGAYVLGVLIGDALAAQAKWESAAREYQRVLDRADDVARAHLGLALCFENMKSKAQGLIQAAPGKSTAPRDWKDEAAHHFQRALDIAPDMVSAYVGLSGVLVEKGHVDEALARLKAAAKIDPRDAEVHYRLGIVYEMKGLSSDALREFERALQLDQDHAGAKGRLEKLRSPRPKG